MEARRERSRPRRKLRRAKKKSLPERLLGRGDPRITFFVGVLLSFPGASYLAALTKTAKLEIADPWLVLIVLGVCVLQQALLEVPIVAYTLWPEPAKRAIARFREWLARNGRRAAAHVAIALGVLLLVVRGVIEFIAAASAGELGRRSAAGPWGGAGRAGSRARGSPGRPCAASPWRR